MTFWAKAAPFAFLLVLACQSTGPKKALEDYRSAVVKKDANAVLALSDDKTRLMWSQLAQLPDGFRLALEAQSATAAVVRQSMHYELEDGSTLVIGLEDGAWRVKERLRPVPAASPEQALRIFVAAALSERLDVVRTFIPGARLDAYGDDGHLSAHLAATKNRLQALSVALPDAPAARRPQPGRAEIVWAPGRTAKLEKEADGWKVLDLE